MRYLVRIYRQGGDYSAMVPDLPGCVAAGESVDEVRTLIADAISLHIDMMRRSGERVSAPTRIVDLNVDELEEGELCTWVDVQPRKPQRKAVGRR